MREGTFDLGRDRRLESGGLPVKKIKNLQDLVDRMPFPPRSTVDRDLNNQILSKDPLERVRQLEWQAQRDTRRMLGQ